MDQPLDSNTKLRTPCGYSFRPTSKHFTLAQVAVLKQSYDVLGEEAFIRLNALAPPDTAAAARNVKRAASGAAKGEKQAVERDTYALLEKHQAEDEVLGKLWKEVNEVPDWVEWEQIERGQEVLWRYAAPSMVGFAFQGLIGGTGSSYRPSETLIRTGGHSVKVARHRFFETFQHLLQVTKSLESIQPGGEGFKATIRVRLLHAAVRERIMKLVRQRPAYYDVEKFGVPINDLDNISALCTFSTNVLWLGLPRQGIWARKQEIIDFIALWRYVGYVSGAPTFQMETPDKAKAAMESLLYEAVIPSHTTRVLAHNIIKSLTDMPPTYASEGYWQAGTRWINGNDLADDMEVGRPKLYHWVAFAGQCCLCSGICYICRDIPYLDKKMIKVSLLVTPSSLRAYATTSTCEISSGTTWSRVRRVWVKRRFSTSSTSQASVP